MPEIDTNKMLSFASSDALNQWLKENHARENELWVRIYKKGSKVQSVMWKDVVIESLCWGWIDGVKKSLDELSYVQRITPRKPQSNWSKINTEHVEHLIAEGRMEEPGMVHVRAAKADGRWENAYAPPSQTAVPQDFLDALETNPNAKHFFDSLTKSSRYSITYGLTTAKKPETRKRRFDKFMGMLERAETPGFGFKKKPTS